MAGDLAAKQSRAEQLRDELRVLRVQRSVDIQDVDSAAQETKLDDEIALLEQQVAIARHQAETGGSVTEAMDAMALAAKLEEENAATVAAPVVVGSPDEKVEPSDTPSGNSETQVDEAQPTEEPATPPIMGLVNPGGNV